MAENTGLTDLEGQEIDSNWDEVSLPLAKPLVPFERLTHLGHRQL